MSDEIKPEEAQPKVVFQIFIKPTGEIYYQNAIPDKVLILGMLEDCKLRIHEQFKQNEVKIHKPEHNILNFARNGHK